MDEYNTYHNLQIVFLKIGNDYKVLKNQKYELVPYDTEKSTGIFSEEGTYGQYFFNGEDYNSSFSIDILPQYLKNEIDKIQTIDDYRALADRLDNFSLSSGEGGEHGLPLLSGYFHIPVKLKQIKGSPGYKNQDLGILLNVDFTISYDRNTNEILYKDVYVSAWEQAFVDLDEFSNVKTLDEMVSLTYNVYYNGERACINTNNDRIIIEDPSQCTVPVNFGSGVFSLVPFFMDEEGVVKFEISNSVNGLAKYNASNNKNLEYEIIVKNTGTASSSQNVIVTNVPKQVIVDENSISNSGTFNASNNTITWNIDYINSEEQILLYYRAIAPNDVNGEELIGNSNVLSAQVTTKTYSNNTIVTLDKMVEIIKNPKTGITMIYIPNTNLGMPLSVFLMIIVIISITSIMFVKKVKKKRLTQ